MHPLTVGKQADSQLIIRPLLIHLSQQVRALSAQMLLPFLHCQPYFLSIKLQQILRSQLYITFSPNHKIKCYQKQPTIIVNQVTSIQSIFKYSIEIIHMQPSSNNPILLAAVVFIACLLHNFSQLQPLIIKEWKYQIHDNHIIADGHNTIVQLNHQQMPYGNQLTLITQFKNGQVLQLQVDEGITQTLVNLDIERNNIRQIVVKSQIPLVFESNVRLLQATTDSTGFLKYTILIFQSLLEVGRNLILIGLVFNMIDVFLPYIILTQSFLMLGMWSCQKHYLYNLYYNVFNSKWDIINALRLMSSSGADTDTISALSQYNFNSLIISNISGQLIVTILLLAFTIFAKVGTVFLKSQKLRQISSKMRTIWNGFFFSIFPRIATFTGFHFRMIQSGSSSDVLNGMVCTLLCALFLFYFIQLLIQIRRINSKVEYIDQSRMQIGLVTRIDYKKQFQFDCLQYSILYYPVMNYLRLLFFYLPIGASYDFYYCSYGGAIVAQLFMMMIQVSCTGYVNKRDKILFPIHNFLMMIVQLCIITVGLAESVSHSEVSQIAEIVIFSILIFVLGTSLIGITLDSIQNVKQRCFSKPKDQEQEEQEEATQKFVRSLGKQTGTISEVKKSDDDSNIDDSAQGDEVDHSSISLNKNTYKIPNLKIKKVRKGKII